MEFNSNLSSSAPNVTSCTSFRQYSLFLILPVGISGNLLSCIVFGSCRLRGTPAGHYVIALAIVDTFVLLSELFLLLDPKMLNIMRELASGCAIVYYFRYSFKLLSSLLVVCIACERFVIVVFPMKKSQLSTAHSARRVVLVLAAFSFCACSYALLTLNWSFSSRGCAVIERWMLHYTVAELLVSVGVGEVLTSFAIFTLTALIVRALLEAAQVRRQLAARQPSEALESQVTAMLMTVAVFFVVLHLPYTFAWLVIDIREIKKEPVTPVEVCISECFYVFAVLNYAINFFLYCLTGEAVRNRLKLIFQLRTAKNGSQQYRQGTRRETSL